MNLNSTTEMNLLNTLRTLGVLQNQSTPNPMDITDTGTNSVPNGVACQTLPTVDSVHVAVSQLSRNELLRATQHLVEGLLRVQTRASATAPSYLGVVFPCLFHLTNNEHQDVRIAADEGINKLIKFLRVSMTHQVIFELLLEIKRGQNSRSIVAALSKFAMLTPRIRPSKLRFYTASLLPVLIDVCRRDDESIFKTLIEHFPRIASQLFYHATERELREFLRHQMLRLNSETALIRRAIAQLLVLACQHSRFALPLLQLLLQRVLAELIDPNETISSQRRGGLLNTLRYLAIAWHEVLNANPSSLLDEHPPNSHPRGTVSRPEFRSPATVNGTRLAAHSGTDVRGLGPADSESSSSYTTGTTADNSDSANHWASQLYHQETEVTEIVEQLWSFAFLVSLDLASSSNGITVCTAALEALSQMLQTGCPARLYLRRWVFRDMNWLTTNTPYTGFSSNLSVSSYEPSLIDESEETQNLSIDPLRQLSHSSLDAELSNDILGPSNASEPSLVRSLSSNSLVSLDPPDSEMTEPNQRAQQQQVDEIRKQLSAVRAQLVQQGSLNGINSVATDGDYALVSSEASDDAEADDASAVVSVSGAPLESKSARLLTLREFLAQIVATTRLNSSTSSRDHGFPLSECHWLLDYLVLHFCLVPNVSNIPRPDVLPRTSSQLLAVTCLTRLCRFYPNLFLVPLQLDRCCSQSPGTVDFPTAVDLILDLMEFHSDPQLRGQLCVLSGRLIAAFLTTENLVVSKIVGADLTPNWPDWSKARSQLERLLTGLNTVLATETVGNIVRLAVIGLAHSANAILQFGGRTHHLHSEHQQQQQLVCPPSLVARLLRCLSTYLVKLARHSYRLVRRECMVMIGKLDWHQILYLECQPDTKSSCHNLTRPVRLIDLAWIECWRLLFDPDGDLRAFAADTLLTLSTVLTASGTDTIPAPRHTRLLHHYLERRLHYWFSNSYSLTQAPAVSHGLTECWSSQSYPPCLSDIPIELDVGPASIRHHLPDSVGTNLPYLELINAEDLKHRASLSGSMKLFRQCVSALLELPCASLLTDDRHMLHGVIHCLNRILGQTHILAHTRIWYDECSISPDPSRVNKSSSAAEATTMTTTATNSAGSTDNTPSQSLLDRQRRPRIALLSWHCLTLLSATNVIAVDLELHAEVVSLTTGCLTRWAIHALTEGSISTGPASMSLDLQHAYTRFALSFLHHIARMLFVLWHIVDEITPGPAPSAGLIADPFHPDAPIGILNSISILAQTGANAVAQATQAAANKAVHSAAATATANLAAVGSQTGTTRRGLKLNSPLRKIAHADSTGTNTGPSESRTSPAVRRLLGYFSHLPHYMSIYRTLKSAFQVYKISGDLIGDNDRFMGILRVYLFALSRLMTNIRLAEIAPYSEELLAYVSKLYHWQPAFCLEAASQILRAFVGTNLISHWDEHLARLYNISLNGSYASDQGHCESVGRGQTPMKSTPESGMERVGVLNIMNQLFKRHRNRVGLLSAESSIPISSIAKWTETTAHLSRTPITAWIRFARQWRVPLPLTSRASVIKSELAQFFKVFEHIVLQSMEMYRWTTCSDLQTSILNLLTHLICLRLNYEQLDTGQQFLKTVINHCQNLSLEVQRQTPLSTAKPGFRGCSSNDTFNGSANSRSPAVTITCPQATRQRLVHAMFRFLVSLAYYPQKSKPVEATSATGISSEEGSNVANAAPSPAKLVEFGQVMHMAETLVAEALDPSSVVLSSLAPVVADLFVIQRPLHTTIQKDTAVIAFPTSPEQAEVQREAVLGFMLRRLAHLPASYDQLCLILEEASLNPNVNDGSQPAVIGGDRPSKVVEAIFSVILAHLNSGTAVLNSRNDFSALLRLFDHVLLALTSQPTVNAELCSKMLQQLNKIMIAAVQSRILFDGHTDSIVFRRWAVMHVACTRLFLNLLRLLERSDRAANRTGGASVDRVFDAASPCPGLGQRQDTMDCLKLLSILALPLSVLDAILDATHSHLCSYPQLANQLSLLVLNGTEIADTSAGLSIQLLLNHLISLHDLVESDFYQIALTKFGLWNPVEISWLSDPTWDHDCAQLLTSITNRILLVGHFEPLLCTLWHQFIADIRRSTESYPGETNRMLENLCTAPYPWLNSTSTVLADEIVTQTVLLTYLRESLNQEEKSVTLCHQLFNSASDYAPDWNLISIKRLFTLWQMGEPAVRQFFSQIGQCATSSRLLLEQCARIIPHLSLSDLRISLQLIVGPLHPSVAGQQLAVLWDHFIAPRQQLHDRMDSKCSGCARNPLPLGLQNQAIRAACVQLERLIRVTSSPTGIDGNEAATNLRSVTVPIPLAVLMDYCARLPRHLTLPGLVQLGELLDRLVDKMAPGELSPRQGRVAPQREQSDTVLDVVSVIKRIDENRPDWLLVPIQSLLISPCSITGVRMATRLLQLLVSLKVEHIDQKIKELLRKTCPSCCSRLLQYALTLDSGLPYPGLGQSDKTSPMPEVQVSKITPQMNTLFRMAQDSLLDQIQKIVLHPEQLIDHESDCLLRDSAHSRLTGLCIALVHYLRLVPYLAATDAIPIESESLALRFLRILVEFSLYLFGYPIDRLSQFHSTPVRDSSSPETRRIQQPGASLSPSFLHSVLDLMDTLLQITAGQCLKGVDMLGDEANQILATFFAFLAAVDHSASLTQPVTYWACGLQCPVETSSDSLFDPVPMISRLLAPSHPSLFAPGNGWCPDSVPASVIAAFTSLSSSCSASAVFAGPSTTVPNVIAATGWTIEPQGFVQPNQLLGHCRLLRSALALVNESALAGEVNACLIGCIRILNSRPSTVASSNPQIREENDRPPGRTNDLDLFTLSLEPDPEILITQIARLGSFGWLDRRQFEQMWMACLELLAGANEEEPNEGVWSTTAPAKTPASEFNAAEAESIERNQCIVLGLHGLTRLLLDVSLRPRPGDPIHSSVPHQPRLSTPHFSYTRLGRKLTSLTSMIEYERLRLHLPYGGTCPNFTTAAVTIPVNAAATNPSVHALSASSSCTWFGQLISPDATDSVAELASSVEANLERLADAPDSVPGPSQFAVHWLVRRLMPRTDDGPDKGDGTEETKADTELNSAQMDQFRNEDFVLNSRPYRVIPAAHSIADYEDLLFSCLQSTQLLYQSWLRSPTMNSSTSYTDSFPDGPNADASSVSISTPTSSSAFSGANAGTGTTPRPVSSESQNEIVSQKGLALAPLLAVIRSTVILSDLFTSREQFLWLTHYLQDVQDKLPSPKEFPAPIHYWITLGLARCVAVLELARSGPQTEPLHEATLEPVVRQILAVLQTNVTILQDVGLQASMLLLHAALLIRAQPHQRQTQQHSPPTGSPSLNELYSQICLYLEQKLVTLFTPPAPVSPSSSSSVSASSKSTSETFRPVPGTPRWIPTPATDATKSSSGSGTSAGFKRFMSGVFGGGGGVGFGGTKGSLTGTGIDTTVKFDSVGTGMHIGSSSSSFPAPGSASLVNRVERHQLIVLATAFFLTEHFSAPPIYPVLTDFGSGLTEMLSGLTSNLFRLAQSMLSDNAAFLASSSGTNISALSHYAVLGAGTTSDLYYSPAVHAAWCRGIERLVLMGRLGKGATESLQKLCVMRLRTCRSAHLSLPVLRLLITCMYTNAGRLNTQLQHYRRVSPTGDKATSTSGFSSSSVNRGTESKAIRPSDSASVTYARSKKLPETTTKHDLATLPPSLLTDSEATAGMTQEFLSCLWERLRGGVAPVMHTSGEPSWVTSAWTSAAEASVIAHLLPVASTDIIQAIAGLLVHNSPQSQASQLGWDRLVIDGHLEDPVLNKALGEFARLDHAHPDLAAQTLAQLFGRFLDRPGGQALIRQWVILSLPTLLSRQPRRLAIWATTVCLLAASTEPSLRAALCLCSTQVAFTYTSDSAEYRDPSGESSQLSSASAIAFRQQTSPLLSDLLCLSAVHFVRSGLLSRSSTSLDEELIEHRQAFRRMFEPLPGGEFEFCAATADQDERTLRRVYTLLQRELAGDN